jgi:transcriptional regulator with XRE-family HTH domain
MHPASAEPPAESRPGMIVRAARITHGLTLGELGKRTGYSAAQVSRYERGVTPLTDIMVLRRFATTLSIPPHVLGLAASPEPGFPRHSHLFAVTTALPGDASSTVAGRSGPDDSGEDDVRRRQLLASLALAAAGAVTAGTADLPPALPAGESGLGELLIGQVRDAMLGLAPSPPGVSSAGLRTGLAAALADFHHCRYARLAGRLPRLISAGHLLAADGGTEETGVVLAAIYMLTTRMLIKLDDTQLGWMAADRAKVLGTGGDGLLEAEAARNLAVLARKAGWHEQAMSIALTAAASPRLRGADPRLAAERGLLIQSAAYTAARAGDRDGMRELTGQAAALAEQLGGAVVLSDHGGGFTPATVGLHRISAENYAGDPGAAIAAATVMAPASLPTTERRARYWTDTARAYAQWGRREDCIQALLAAEHEAPQEIHARPAVRDLIRSQLITGRASRELRGLAQRCGIT